MSVMKLNTVTLESGDRDLRKTDAHPDYWYPLARSGDVKPGKTIGRTFAGEPIVIIRAESGRIFALEDRCAHRQVPLSKGKVSGERIQCCYHGWVYDDTGRCVNIPYVGKSDVMPRGVRAYPCREEYGLIFVFPGNAGKASVVQFPDVPTWHDPKYKTRYLDRRVDCHYSFLHENLMDMNHQFLHRRIMSRIRTGFLDLREGDDWVEVDYTFSRVGKTAHGREGYAGETIRADRGTPPGPDDRKDAIPPSTVEILDGGQRTPGAGLVDHLCSRRQGTTMQPYLRPDEHPPALDTGFDGIIMAPS